MPDQVKNFLTNTKTRWDMLTRPQQLKLVGVIVVVIAAIAFTAFLTFRRTYSVLVNNQDMVVISNMAAVLQNEGIRYRFGGHGSRLYVDDRYRIQAMGLVTAAGHVPHDDMFTWADALETGLGTTESERNQRHRLATESAAAQMLMMQQGIAGARVQLNIPPVRPFDPNAPPATAVATVITTQPFNNQQARSLALIVTHQAVGLLLENVIIVDQHSRTLFDGSRDDGQDMGDAALQSQDMYRNFANMTLHNMLAANFDEVIPMVNLVFERHLFTEEVAEIFRIPEGMEGGGIVQYIEDRRAEVTGTDISWAPGTAWNAQGSLGYPMGAPGIMEAMERERTAQYALDTIRSINQLGPGWLNTEESTISVQVVRHRNIRQPIWESENPGLTEYDWIQYKDDNRNATLINDYFSGFDALVANLANALNIPISNVSLLIWEQPMFFDTEFQPLNIPLIIMLVVLFLLLLLLAFGLLHRQKVAEEDGEPELSVEDLLVSTQMEEEKDAAAQELETIDYQKENEIKKQIDKFVNEKPEAVAALLRNWINIEEW